MNHLNICSLSLWLRILLCVQYLALPFMIIRYYLWVLDSGFLPPDSDAVGIPIAGGIIIWIFMFPLFLLGLLILRNIEKDQRLVFIFNKKKSIKSIVSTVLFLFLALRISYLVFEFASVGDLIMVAYLVLCLGLLFFMRGYLLAKTR